MVIQIRRVCKGNIIGGVQAHACSPGSLWPCIGDLLNNTPIVTSSAHLSHVIHTWGAECMVGEDGMAGEAQFPAQLTWLIASLPALPLPAVSPWHPYLPSPTENRSHLLLSTLQGAEEPSTTERIWPQMSVVPTLRIPVLRLNNHPLRASPTLRPDRTIKPRESIRQHR